MISPSTLTSATPGLSFLSCLIYDRKRFGFSLPRQDSQRRIFLWPILGSCLSVFLLRETRSSVRHSLIFTLCYKVAV